jgi:hypothetical protein
MKIIFILFALAYAAVIIVGISATKPSKYGNPD